MYVVKSPLPAYPEDKIIANMNSGKYLQLPVVELPTWRVVVTEITTATDSSLLKLIDELVTLVEQVLFVLS